MTSETDICNLALSFVGKPEITSLDERSTAAGWCRRAYPIARRAVLSQSDWVFARTYATLIATAAPSHPDYGRTFARPNDAIRIRAVGTGDSPYRRGAPWTPVAYDLIQGSIMARGAATRVWYTRDVTDPDEWPSGIAEAVAYKLASLIAPQATGRPSDAIALAQMYAQQWQEAAQADAGQELTTWTPRDAGLIVGGEGAMTAAEFASKVDFPYDETMLWGPAGVGTPVSEGGGAEAPLHVGDDSGPGTGTGGTGGGLIDEGTSDLVGIYEANKDA